MQPQYNIYATLLDSFEYFMHSDREGDLQEMLDRINRVKREPIEAASRGTAFNNIMDEYLHGGYHMRDSVTVEMDGFTFTFQASIMNEIAEIVGGTPACQVYSDCLIPCKNGLVNLYGYADWVRGPRCMDLKTTGNYTFPKFLKSIQKSAYPLTLRARGIDIETFDFIVTDFSSVYVEAYPVDYDRCTLEVTAALNRLTDFLETYRGQITDEKIFNIISK